MWVAEFSSESLSEFVAQFACVFWRSALTGRRGRGPAH